MNAALSDCARFVRAQPHFSVLRLVRRALDVFGAAYDERRDALAGRNDVAEYVHTLTPEVTSPVSPIRGAAALLQEPRPVVQRQRFLLNILRETQRIQEMVGRLMALTTLKSRRVLKRVQHVARVGQCARFRPRRQRGATLPVPTWTRRLQ